MPFSNLVVIKVGDRLWRTYEEFTYRDIVVPKGFLTDLASVPRLFWAIIPPDGRYTQAAVVHDWKYAIQDCTRKEADQIFLEAMRDLNVPAWKRQVMWAAVRTFGWLPWNNHARKGTVNIEP